MTRSLSCLQLGPPPILICVPYRDTCNKITSPFPADQSRSRSLLRSRTMRPKPQEIEYRVRQLVEAVGEGQPIEDDLVEAKSEWLDDHYRAARRIAGHANAARGEPILWVIGLDEKRGVIGAEAKDFAEWWPQVQKWFDEGIAPEPTCLNVPTDSGVLVALLMDTARSPFVVKSPAGGPASREVPWRKATALQSATRGQLIDMLVPISRRPQIRVTGGRLRAEDEGQTRRWVATLELFIVPLTVERVVLPWREGRYSLEVEGRQATPLPGNTEITARSVDHALTRSTPGLAIVDGPGYLRLTAHFLERYKGEKTEAPLGDQYLRGRIETAGGLAGQVDIEAVFEPGDVKGFGGVYGLKRSE